MSAVHIVWNGCDNYIEVDKLRAPDYKVTRYFDGSLTLHTNRGCSFNSICSVRVPSDAVPIVNGEQDYKGFYVTECGNIYKERLT